jgi:RsiW-degrading membrane proteinase PrsW (M82 family)
MSFPPPPPAYGPVGAPVGGARPYPHRIRRERRGVLGAVLGLVALGFCGLLVFSLLVLNIGSLGDVAVGALCALLPVGPVVAAFIWLDRWEPEPPRLLLFAFLWGACFAALAALILNSGAEAVASLTLGSARSQVFSAVFVAPWVEEAMKGSFVLGLLLFRRREFDGVLDGVVYAGIVAAGFAFTENILYLGTAYAHGAADGGVLPVLIMRGVLSPFAHPLFTSMTGIGLGLAANARHVLTRVLAPVLGYLTAVCLHALWNGSASLGAGTLVGVYLLVMLPIFAFVVAVVLYQRRREQRVIAAELPGFAAAGWIAQSEAHLLQSMAGRRGWLRAVRKRSGPAVARMVADYQAAITELAILRHRMARGSLGPHARQWHDELLEDMLYKRAKAVGSPDALHAAWGRQSPPPGWVPPPAPVPGPGWAPPGARPAAAPGAPGPSQFRPPALPRPTQWPPPGHRPAPPPTTGPPAPRGPYPPTPPPIPPPRPRPPGDAT